MLSAEYWLLRWYCEKWSIPPHDKSLDDVNLSDVWVMFVEEEILQYLAEHPKSKLADLEVGDVWIELGNNVRAIKKRLLHDRPSLGEDKALEMARKLYRERVREDT